MATSFSLGVHFTGFVNKMLESGRYQNASEVLRAALRLLEDDEKLKELKLQELRVAIQEGIDSGEGIPLREAVARNRDRLKKRVKK